ncbi:MRG domain-containing protein [Caenorhabditis elegans]|nr:MRG domain-containing protein [Caenorhabditis elegans]CCF23370.1 MRG domain-containing protein [Caenorhabditis elegans]|eukprot:NP_001251254.1 Ectopic P Granules [Caenorhabditis elegans]
MNCKNCNKKTNCCCKKCTLEKLKIYSRRENITQRYEEKERLQAEILAFIDPTESLKEQITIKEDRLIKLHIAVENAKMRIAMKQSEVNKLDTTPHSKPSQFDAVFTSQSNFISRADIKKKEKSERLTKLEEEVAKKRLKYCIHACRIFPVQVYDVNVESVTVKSKNSKNWAVVNDSELQKGLRIAIRNSYINDKLRAKLANQLSNGTISLPLDLHPPFAAFTNTLQLVHLLSVIFNFRPPETLSHHDLCIRERWTKESLNRDWSTLCDAVIYLCIFIGMSHTKLKYTDPHHNLIALASFVVNDYNNINRIGSRPMCDLSEVHALIEAQRPEDCQKKDELDESWTFVD